MRTSFTWMALAIAGSVAVAQGPIELNSDFENGSLRTWSLDDGVYTVSPGIWLHFRADGVRGQAPRFRVAAPEGNEPYRAEHRMVWSSDGRTWQYMDLGSTPGDGYYYFGNEKPFAQDRVWIAYWYPYTYSQVQAFMERIGASPHVRDAGARGTSVQGRSVYGFAVTDPAVPDEGKRHVVFVARQHGYESLGNYVVEGLVDFLLSDAPEAAELRRRTVFHVYPMANPDAVFTGGDRGNAEGVDLNRQWRLGAPSHGGEASRGRETDVLRDAIVQDTGGQAAIMVDVHSHAKCSGHDGWYWWSVRDREDRLSERLTRGAWEYDRQAHGDEGLFTAEGWGPAMGALSISAGGWGCGGTSNGTLGGAGFTLEPITAPYGKPRSLERIRSAGASIARAIHDTLLTPAP